MLQKKSKGIFAEVSPYEIRLAKTDRLSSPVQVEDLLSIPVSDDETARREVEEFAGTQKGGFCQASCAVYPPDRFLFRYQTDNAARTRAEDFATRVLQGDLKRQPGETAFRMLHPASGKAYDPTEALSREVLFVGAGTPAIREEQSRLLHCGLYPRRLQVASVALYAGVRRAIVDAEMNASVLLLELNEDASYAYVVNMGGLALSHPVGFGVANIVERIQKELHLQDRTSARKVMLSRTFDFRDMAPSLLGRLVGQLRASTGQFEVQTGKSVDYLHVPGLPRSLSWVAEVLAEELGMEIFQPSLAPWLEKSGISLTESASVDAAAYFPLFCQMADLEIRTS